MTQEEHVQQVLARREAALLDIRFRAAARAGQPVARAYQQPIPVKMKPMQFAQQWT